MARGGTTSGGDGADDTGDDGSGGGSGDEGGVPCGYPGMLGSYTLEVVPTSADDESRYRLFTPDDEEPSDDCNFAGLVEPSEGPVDLWALPDQEQGTGGNFEVFVYYPQDQSGAWPEGVDERPVVFLGPGNAYTLVNGAGSQESDHYYLETIRGLVEDGFVVFGIDPVTDTMSTRERRAAMACTMLWARDEWEPDYGTNDPVANPLSDYVALAGHSRSGAGAYLLTNNLMTGEHLPSGTSLDDWEQCATITFAQNYNPGSVDGYAEPNPDVQTPPFLTMLGTVDEDTTTQSITAFDNRVAEAVEEQSGRASWDEVAVVVHGEDHARWGGSGAQRNEFGPFYTREFLQWQMMGDDAGRRRFMDLIDSVVDPCAFDDLTFADPGDWTGDNLAWASRALACGR